MNGMNVWTYEQVSMEEKHTRFSESNQKYFCVLVLVMFEQFQASISYVTFEMWIECQGAILTLSRLHTLFWHFHCWLWTSKYRLGKINVASLRKGHLLFFNKYLKYFNILKFFLTTSFFQMEYQWFVHDNQSISR